MSAQRSRSVTRSLTCLLVAAGCGAQSTPPAPLAPPASEGEGAAASPGSAPAPTASAPGSKPASAASAAVKTAATAACQNAPPEGFVDLAASLKLEIRYATAENFTGAPLPGYGAPGAWMLAGAAKALAAVD